MSRIRAIVSGRVQMVMFRDFAQRKARRLGIVGSVENLKDGTVEIYAQAEGSVLEKYVKKLWRGSLLSRVDDVRVTELEPSTYEDFVIIYPV